MSRADGSARPVGEAAGRPGEAPDASIDRVEAARDRLLSRGRAAIGVSGDHRPAPLRATLREHGVGFYPVVAIGLLGVVDGLQTAAIGILGPDISRTLGMSAATYAGLNVARGAALALATVVIAHIVGRHQIRALIAIVTAFLWSIATLFTGLVRTPTALAAVNTIDGASSGSVAALHTPMLMDTYPPAVRVRVISLYVLFLQAAGLFVPLLIAFLTGVVDLTWRGILLAFGVVSLSVAVFSVRLRDPGFGRWDTERIRAAVAEDLGQTESGSGRDREPDTSLGFFEVVRRLLLMPTMRIAVTATVLSGMASAPLATYFQFYLADRWQLDATERALFSASVPLLCFGVVPVIARLGERFFTRDPADVLRLSARLQIVGALMLALSVVSPSFAVMVGASVVSSAIPIAITPVTSTTFMAVVPARMRSHTVALLGVAQAAAGGVAGVALLSTVDSRLGLQAAILALIVPLTVSYLLMMRAARTVNGDLNQTVQAVLEDEELSGLRAAGVHLPLLACRNVDFSYGSVQTLFGVDLTVEDGEMVALLGTNGAGKSTLLSVIAGLNLPSAGSVRLAGADITYLDAERRSGLGIVQIRGGDAVFPSLSVAENLRMFGFAHGRDRHSTERAIDEAFDCFPGLADRRNQRASTLSGGQQQMLGFAQALIVKPRLLCVDELSLGLAPSIVAELLELVRRINNSGTGVVLVEQSASVALSLAHRAYFMERGQIRFEGACEDLRGRDDLLRAVFLEGAAAAKRTGEAR